MAINLKKESYSENNDNSGTVRTVYPEHDSEEIYPQREVYPQREAYTQTMPQEQTREEIYPQQPMRTQTACDALPQARTLPPQPPEIYNRLPKPVKRKKRKKKKHILINLIVLCVALTAVGKGMQEYFESRGYNFVFYSDSKFSERTIDIAAADISALTISDNNSSISIVPSNDGDFHITVSESSEKQYSISESAGGTVISGSKFFSLVTVSGGSSISVAVPEEYSGKITVDSANSKVECSAGDDINIDSSNGRITLSDLRGCKNITVSNSNSTVKASNIYTDELSINNSNGGIKLENAEVSGKAVLHSDNSRVDVSYTRFGTNGNLSSQNGSMEVSDCILGNDMILSAENGSVSLYDSSFENLLVKARNGSIRGSAYGDIADYTVKASASNGSSDIESGGSGNYRLDLDSSNGSIRFDFDGSRPAV